MNDSVDSSSGERTGKCCLEEPDGKYFVSPMANVSQTPLLKATANKAVVPSRCG